MTSRIRHLATAVCRWRNAWWQVSTEEQRLQTAMAWAHYHLAEDCSEASALWVMYFLDRAMVRGANLDTAAVVARGWSGCGSGTRGREMGLLTKASHQHYCDGCKKGWTHAGYSCNQPGEYACPECREPKT